MSDQRFLILRGGAIGDTLLTLPVVDALRERWPDAYVEWVGYPRTNALIEAAGLVDQTRSLDRAEIASLFSFKPSYSDGAEGWLKSFDLVIHFLYDPDGLVTQNLKALIGITKVHSQTPMPPEGVHASDHYLKVLEGLTIFAEGRLPRLPLLGKAHDWSTVIHPGSGSMEKNWSLDGFLELYASAPKPVILLGEADRLLAASLPPGLDIWQGHSLMETARMIASCDRFIGNDSGMAHLAAAMGVPTTVIFGASDTVNWAPRGAHVNVIQAPEGRLRLLTAERVLAHV